MLQSPESFCPDPFHLPIMQKDYPAKIQFLPAETLIMGEETQLDYQKFSPLEAVMQEILNRKHQTHQIYFYLYIAVQSQVSLLLFPQSPLFLVFQFPLFRFSLLYFVAYILSPQILLELPLNIFSLLLPASYISSRNFQSPDTSLLTHLHCSNHESILNQNQLLLICFSALQVLRQLQQKYLLWKYFPASSNNPGLM